MLERVRIVLVGTSHPGNIGAAARAMKTMGMQRLCLVAPERFPHADATAMASGADDLLASAEVHDTLPPALAGAHLVMGASARLRSLRWPVETVRSAGDRVLAKLGEDPANEVALVFGRERSGLTNEEMDRCHALLNIPTSDAYSSLNLAQAVQVAAYEVRRAWSEATEEEAGAVSDEAPVTADELEGLYEHYQRVLQDIGFLDPVNPKHLMRRLRRLYNRVHLNRNELNILRGILSAVEDRGRRSDDGRG